MPKQLRPGHSCRRQVVKQRRALPDGQRVRTTRQQHAGFFKHLARRATDYCGALPVCFAIFDGRISIGRFGLAARKRIEAAEKDQFGIALDPENFRVVGIGILAEENYGGGIFGLIGGLHVENQRDSDLHRCQFKYARESTGMLQVFATQCLANLVQLFCIVK